MYPRSMFLAKIRKKNHNYSSENYHFYICEILRYITRACLRNAGPVSPAGFTSMCLQKLHNVDMSVLKNMMYN